MVVAGTGREWRDVPAERWQQLADELGGVVAAAGGAWLTMRAYEPGDRPADGPPGAGLARWQVVAADARCTVIVDPVSDGRERFAEAMRTLPPTVLVDEKSIAGALYEPADVEPDLVVILGPSTRLPPSLVWELAYGELVFLPVAFADLGADHVAAAIDDFHHRQRRFGGLET
jgi:undecaprenyl diphosphate synthase